MPLSIIFSISSLLAIRQNKWKYHVKHFSDNSAYILSKPGPFLFDLERDPNESYNLIMRHPEIADNLLRELKNMQQSLRINLRGWIK